MRNARTPGQRLSVSLAPSPRKLALPVLDDHAGTTSRVYRRVRRLPPRGGGTGHRPTDTLGDLAVRRPAPRRPGSWSLGTPETRAAWTERGYPGGGGLDRLKRVDVRRRMRPLRSAS